MKKARALFLILLAAVLVGSVVTPVRADTPDQQLSDAQVDQVRQNCKQAQSTLQRLQTTDVATRVNRGRIYESLINRLITPFNTRVSLNQYDATSFNAATTTISQKFSAFKNDYQSYADSFSDLLSINCEANPRGFYNLLVTTRSSRQKLSDDIAGLNGALDKYTEAFTSLRNSLGGQS